MFRKQLTDFLNRQVWLQYIFVIMPLIMVAIYGYAYMTDMLGISRSLAYNDSISARAFDDGTLREVVLTETVEDGVRAVIGSDLVSTEKVAVDDVIFYIQMYNTDWYQLVTSSGPAVMLESCSLFEAAHLDEYKATVTHEDFSHEFEYGDLVCAVTVADNGFWRVTFLVDDGPHYDLESLSMVELVEVFGGSYTVNVYDRYEVVVPELELNFCSELPSSATYYNESTKSFVQNVSSDYAKLFMLRANYITVVLAVLIYCLLLCKLSGEGQLILLKNKYLFNADVFAFCVLLMIGIFTMIML